MRFGGHNEDLLVQLITEERFPAPPGHAWHAGQGDPGRLHDPAVPPPSGAGTHTHKDPMLGTVFVGAGRWCEHCAAQLEAGG
jgi:hypothetical protein